MKKSIAYIINLFKASKTFSIIVACSTALIVTASVGTAVLLGEEKQPVNAAQTSTTEAASSTTNETVVKTTEYITDTSTEKPTETTTKKSSPTTSTTKKVETTTKKYSGSPYSTYVKPNASLTWNKPITITVMAHLLLPSLTAKRKLMHLILLTKENMSCMMIFMTNQKE